MAKCGENIYKRKDGRWEGRFIRGRKENGHAIYGYVYSRSYTECKGKLKAAATAPLRAVCVCRLTANELFSSLLRQKCADVKPSTAQRYRFLIEKHILPELGHLRVEQLTAKKLQTFLQHKQANGGLRGGGLSAKTVRDIGTLIKTALKYAQAEFSVPCDADALRLPSPAQTDIHVFTEDELRRIGEQVTRQPHLMEVGILLALNTGLRIGELCALQRQDVDFAAGTVSVRHTAQRINYGGRTELVVHTPKSAASNRVIPIPAEMLALLRQYVYAFAPGRYLFSGNPVRPLEPRTCQRHFKALLKCCGLPYRNFHSTRHTYATRCVEEGADFKTVSELLGHSNPQITLRRYMHSSMRYKQEVVQRISFLPRSA